MPYRPSFRSRLRRSLEGCLPRLSFGLSLFEDGFCLDLFGFLISLPLLDRWAYEPHEIMESWGVTYHMWAFHLNWGRRCKVANLPFGWDHIDERHQVLRADGEWERHIASYEHGHDQRKVEEFPYAYRLRSGEIQERTAAVHVERREYRRKGLRWCPWFAKKSQYIEIEFNDEVGERAGSWKGGCVGCGYDMLPGESPGDTLRRMERERKF